MAEHLSGTVKDYIRELSARKSTPGGGSAAALSAAAGAALNLMVINYSFKDDIPSEREQRYLRLKEVQEHSVDELSLLMDMDCEAFSSLMQALSSGSGAEKEYASAAGVPLNICRECLKSMEVAVDLSKDSNRNLITDIGCAAYILKGAFFSARLNVEINLKYIKDKDLCRRHGDELNNMEDRIEALFLEAEMNVKSHMKSGD